MADFPEVPKQYELTTAPANGVADFAKTLASDGADEGVVACAPLDDLAGGTGGNLDCAIVLHPEVDASRFGEFAFVSAVSLGQALAAATSPMITMLYGWPDRILLNDLIVARINLHRPAHPEPRLIVHTQMHIQTYPIDDQDAGCLRLVDPESEYCAADVLALYTRHFLHWINHWHEEGFASVLRAWQQRLDTAYGDTLNVNTGASERKVTGSIIEVDKTGALVIEASGKKTIVTIPEFYGL